MTDSPLARIEEARMLLERARTRLPVACNRLFVDYLAGYPTGGDPTATLIDPNNPRLGSVSLTQPERFAALNDDTVRARRELNAAALKLLSAVQTISNLAAQWGTYSVGGKVLDPHELDALCCISCKRYKDHRTPREAYRQLCSWCDDWNRKANAERTIQGKPTRDKPPIALVRRRFSGAKTRVTTRDMIDAVRLEPTPKRTKKRRLPVGSFTGSPTSGDA